MAHFLSIGVSWPTERVSNELDHHQECHCQECHWFVIIGLVLTAASAGLLRGALGVAGRGIP